MTFFDAAIDQKVASLQAHSALLHQAIAAVQARTFYAAWPEAPQAYGEDAALQGKAAYDAQVGKPFAMPQGGTAVVRTEQSPYTQQPLGIAYPSLADADAYVATARQAANSWRRVSPHSRALLLIESLKRMETAFFEIAHATMHTTGQGYMMAFQASGPHAADRALEAVAIGYQELTRFPQHTRWEKPMGKVTVVLEKDLLPVGHGLSLAIGCSTFPVWNSLPGMYASLITGNPVILKPHPTAIYPVAIVVRALQQTLADFGLDPHTVLLATDTAVAPLTKELVGHPQIKLIDFTGSSAFGDFIESLPGKVTFTEKAGVNTIILDSVADLGAVAQNIGFSLNLYSGQMCTCPQNIFIPKGGIATADGHASYADVVKALTDAISGLALHPKAGPAVLGAVQNPDTLTRVADAAALGKVLLPSQAIANAEFPQARTATPLVLEIPADRLDLLTHEYFGPIVFVVPTDSTEHSLRLAAGIAEEKGAISCGAYTTAPEVKARIADALLASATPVSFNFTGPIYVNQNAAFGDFHVTGGNPAGNASLSDPAFLVRRFAWVAIRENVQA